MLMPASIVFADDIVNNLDVTIDATLETMNLTVGGGTGSASYFINSQGIAVDGDNGCNFDGATEAATFSVTVANTAVATANVSSVVFDGPGCGDTPGVTITPVGPGSTSVTLTQTANNTGGTFNVSTATFTVNVASPADTVAPVIDAHADVTAEATSNSGATVTYTAPNAVDNVDGTFAATCSPASGTTFALGNTTVTCNAQDAAGNNATPTTFVVHVVDTTAPVIAAHADVTAEATGPTGAIVNYTSPATSDAVDGAGVATCSLASGTLFALGDTTVNCDAQDAAGNNAIQKSFVVHVVDTTAPVITLNGNATINVTYGTGYVDQGASATDAVDVTDTVVVTGDTVSATTPVGTYNINYNSVDSAGNIATQVVRTINVTPATITVTADNKSKLEGASDPAFTFQYSGFVNSEDSSVVTTSASCSVTGAHSAAGDYPIVCSGAAAANYTFAYVNGTLHVFSLSSVFKGLFNPLKVTIKDFQKNSTIPVKFALSPIGGPNFFGGQATLEIQDDANPGVWLSATSSGGSNTANIFRYDAIAGQYVYNLSTKNPIFQKGHTYSFRITINGITETAIQKAMIKL
jgi:hypothetical protein